MGYSTGRPNDQICNGCGQPMKERRFSYDIQSWHYRCNSCESLNKSTNTLAAIKEEENYKK